MSEKSYKQMLEKASLGYAYHKIIVNEKDEPIDYEFIEVNRAFEALTGLKKDKIINRRITEVLPEILDDEFDWIAVYGKVAITGEEVEFEQHSSQLDKNYNVKVYSPEKYYFITLFSDYSDQRKLLEISKQFIADNGGNVNYSSICENMLEISKAKFVVFNLFDRDTKDFTTVAIAGVNDKTKKYFKILGFNLENKKWRQDLEREKKIKENTITYFNTIYELAGDRIPKIISNNLQGIANIGQLVVVKIMKDGINLGDFTIIMPKDIHFSNPSILKLYASQVGMFLEKKYNENKLIESQKKYFSLAEEAPIGIISFSKYGQITYINPIVPRMFGWEGKAGIESINLYESQLMIDNGITEKFKECLKRKKSLAFEPTFIKENGERIWLSAVMKPIIEFNEVQGVRAIIDDITEKKIWTEKLMESEENFRSFFETMSDLVFIVNKKGNIIHVNNLVIEKLGYTFEEIYQMRLEDVHIGEDEEITKKKISRVIQGKEDTCNLPLRTKKGANIPVETRIWFAEWDGEECIFALSKDLSVEQAALQKFNRIFENNPALMALESVEGRLFTEVNDAFTKKTGYTREEMIGKSPGQLDLIFMDVDQEEVFEKILGNIRVNNIEVKIKTKEGRVLDGLFYGELIESHEKKYFLIVLLDITELRQTQEIIKHMSYHDQLTDVYNRRYFDEKMKRANSFWKIPLSLVMADVNGLKLINDAFGHMAGDELLKKVAEIIKNECRSNDIVARIGGDEFVIILPGTAKAQTKKVIKRIKDNLIMHEVEGINISVAFGCATKEKENNSFVDIFKKAEENMYKNKFLESEKLRRKAIKIIMRNLYKKSTIEKLHSERVSKICVKICEEMKFDNERIEELKNAGLMHDIGKIVIDEKILNTSVSLTDAEWLIIKRHPEAGYKILGSVNEFALIASYVLAHHERWDGNGYPKGISGEDIPIESRIIAVADALDDMVNEKSYKKALTKNEVIEELRENSGTQFDPDIVKIAIKIMKKSEIKEDNIEFV